MEARAYGLLGVLAVLIGFAATLLYTTELDDLNKDYSNAKIDVESLGRSAERQQEVIAQKEADLAKLEGLLDKITGLEKSVASAKANAAKLLNEVVTQEAAFDDAIIAVRQTAVGQNVGSMVLNGGKVLIDVKVKSIRPDHLTVTHGLGVAKLYKKDLPSEVIERFQLENTPPPVAKAEPAADGSDPNAVQADTSATIAKGDPSVKRAKIKDLQGQIAKLRAQITITGGSYNQYVRAASEARSQHNMARSAGRSSSHLVQANTAQASADLLEKQVISYEARLTYLREQLYNLMYERE